jgi:hypothetical protein
LARRFVLRWIGQPLRLKPVVATVECGVSVRVAVAIAAYLLVAILKNRLSLSACLGTLGEMFAFPSFGKQPVARAVSQPSIPDSNA